MKSMHTDVRVWRVKTFAENHCKKNYNYSFLYLHGPNAFFSQIAISAFMHELILSQIDLLLTFFFRHLLVVFGGLKGLETSLESDETLPANDPSLVFDHYVNTCPGQGSGTIRTEEAILVTMSALRPIIAKATTWTQTIGNSL